MKAFVDKTTCVGCGLCTSICPEVFEMDDDSFAKAKDTEVNPSIEDSVKEAAENCPVSAISVE